jgi:regulator of cell morphogenesis and NO signaling
MSILAEPLNRHNATVAELVIMHPAAFNVFTRYNIDYCCGGHRTLQEACTRLGLNIEAIWRELDTTPVHETRVPPRLEERSTAWLAEYIIENHHQYVRETIPEIEALLERICHAHGEDSITLYNIQQDFIDLTEELLNHMEKEEMVVFPALKKLEAYNGKHPLLDDLRAPIGLMEHEHTIITDLMQSIRNLSGDYTPPDYACPTFQITYRKLKEFDDDLMVHIYLENNILFRRAQRQ